jgi:anti-sigma B factor antagonist
MEGGVPKEKTRLGHVLRPVGEPAVPSREPPASLEVEEAAGVTVVRLLDRRILGPEAVAAVGAALDRVVQQARPRLLVDFAAVEYLSSALVGALLKAHRRAGAAGGRLALCGLGLGPAEVLRLAHLDRVLAAYPDRPRALASF